MMFFLALTLNALTVPSRWTVLKLGLAWTGLMWTRPDGFIYFGAVALGFVLFNAGQPIARSRLGLLKAFLCAGAVTTVLYSPWVLWAWHYYGSPIPHTITAKGYVFRVLIPRPGSRACQFAHLSVPPASRRYRCRRHLSARLCVGSGRLALDGDPLRQMPGLYLCSLLVRAVRPPGGSGGFFGLHAEPVLSLGYCRLSRPLVSAELRHPGCLCFRPYRSARLGAGRVAHGPGPPVRSAFVSLDPCAGGMRFCRPPCC